MPCWHTESSMRMSLWIALVAAGAVALAGCSSSREPKKDQPAADAPASQPAPQQEAAAPQKQEAPASFQVRAPATFNVTFDTTKGPVVAEVHRDWAPIGADHFYELVKSGYFDGARFFRVVPNFIVQFGIAGDPAVTRKWKESNLRDDPVPEGWSAAGKLPENQKYGIGVSTPLDMVSILEKLERGEIVSPDASHEILAILKRCQDDRDRKSTR